MAGLAVVLLAAIAAGQVTSPMDINEPGPQVLQSKYMAQLQKLATSVRLQKYPYAFYFSRKLDIDEAQQKTLAQSGIRFERFDDKMVLAVTGNYYASYSAELVDRSHRVRQTFNDVILPILRAAVGAFGSDEPFRTYGFEISHHVRTKVLGVSTEAAENVVILLPREVAHKLVAATTPEQQQAAVLDAEVYLGSKPMVLWLTGDEPQVAPKGMERSARKQKSAGTGATTQSPVGFDLTTSDTPLVSQRLVSAPAAPVRLVTPDTLRSLYLANQDTIARMVRELDPQAHFVPYVLPSFIAFRQGAYLQVPMTTELPAGTEGSQYRLAAMAFDQHIAHLVRPALTYFADSSTFDGIDFSTTVKVPGSKTVQSVEYILGFQAMQCFAKYDCTGQQMLNAGAVLINGERAAVDLQKAQ
ncbi:MAG: hypothetical protein LAN37_13215 [Acidobacteriia bacterium]|nr:hypothetical protein [Terriglobia bacterium]